MALSFAWGSLLSHQSMKCDSSRGSWLCCQVCPCSGPGPPQIKAGLIPGVLGPYPTLPANSHTKLYWQKKRWTSQPFYTSLFCALEAHWLGLFDLFPIYIAWTQILYMFSVWREICFNFNRECLNDRWQTTLRCINTLFKCLDLQSIISTLQNS